MLTDSESNPYQAPTGEDRPWQPSLFRKTVGLLAAVATGVLTFYGIPLVIFMISGNFAFGAPLAVISIFVGIIPAFYLAHLAQRVIVTGKLRK